MAQRCVTCNTVVPTGPEPRCAACTENRLIATRQQIEDAPKPRRKPRGQEGTMPQVGTKHFPYTPAGKAAAAKEAKRTGQPLREAPKGGKSGKGK